MGAVAILELIVQGAEAVAPLIGKLIAAAGERGPELSRRMAAAVASMVVEVEEHLPGDLAEIWAEARAALAKIPPTQPAP